MRLPLLCVLFVLLLAVAVDRVRPKPVPLYDSSTAEVFKNHCGSGPTTEACADPILIIHQNDQKACTIKDGDLDFVCDDGLRIVDVSKEARCFFVEGLENGKWKRAAWMTHPYCFSLEGRSHKHGKVARP